METKSLHNAFGVTVTGIDLNTVDDAAYSQIRTLFEEHSLLVFPDQVLTDAGHIALAKRFGPLEDRNVENLQADDNFKVSQVSNIREDGRLSDGMDLHTLHLKANMLWHADSTFLPVPALTNILTAHIVTETGGETEFASTRAGWAEMPDALRAKVENKVFRHRYAHSRAQISEELAKLDMFTKWPDQLWKTVWTNPVNGRDALYIASHVCGIEGTSPMEASGTIQSALDWVTQPKYVYLHKWTPGDVLIWDQRAILHRATPWEYTKPRKLTSVCVSATPRDGVDAMHPYD